MKYYNAIQSARRSNDFPPSESNWYRFAVALKIGVLDLDDIAREIGQREFYFMDSAFSPRTGENKDLEKVSKAIQKLLGKKITVARIRKIS